MVVLECRCCELPDSQQFIPLVHRNDTKEDVFVHQTFYQENNPRKFLSAVSETGSEAANVTGPGGVPVKGSRYGAQQAAFQAAGSSPRSPPPEDQRQGGRRPGPRLQKGKGENEVATENETARPVPRRRGPRRPPPRRSKAEEGGQQQQQQQQPGGPSGGQQPAAGCKAPEDPQSDEELSDGQCRRHPRQAVRRMQRNSESSASKPANLKSSPKSSPKTTKSPEPASQMSPGSCSSSPTLRLPLHLWGGWGWVQRRKRRLSKRSRGG
ncbi:hypothetical protein CRUP_036117 [Coryphaenoides rupestris]|nr:hypothetical protein CRUP_036117 [Coryphaenoides rupestris]